MKTEEKVGELLKAKNFSLSTAESCTGGGIAALITSVPGSSEYFKGGIVAYSNEVKADLLHVSVETLAQYGAVSRETVVEMVKGANENVENGLRGCHFGNCRSRWRYTGETGRYCVDSGCLQKRNCNHEAGR